MYLTSSSALLTTALSAILSLAPAQVSAAPHPPAVRSTSGYWLESISRQGSAWGNPDPNYKVFRNVKDYNAVGDGVADDTVAIQAAIADGTRCGWGCNSSTTQPALVYFPAGTYKVSSAVQMYYYTQLIGDATNKPTLIPSANFSGLGLLDADPYHYGAVDNGVSWYINQNNFFRQVRNFIFDFTADDAPDLASAIHWQVAQATSLQNLEFRMKPGSNQQGIFMDNGSGGFMSDLIFTGGKIGAFLGSQQFTSRNLVFNNVETAIFMNWNWGWTFSNISITGGNIGIDISNSPSNLTVGSVVLADSSISGTAYGIKTAFGGNGTGPSIPASGGTLILENVSMDNIGTAAVFQNATGDVLLGPGSQTIANWAEGNGYDHTSTAQKASGTITPPARHSDLLLDGKVFGRSKPQYEDVPVANFISAKTSGCKGDGQTDDTSCIQSFLDKVASTQGAIAYFDHGAYLVKDTIQVPSQIKITGEIWPMIVADGASFNDAKKPKAVFQVGKPGGSSNGAVEISDLIFETKGAAPGAVMIEWNLDSAQGDSGMWDSHVRIGGSYGTELQSDTCAGVPSESAYSPDCFGVFLMFHATKSSSGVLLENTWFWVADHDMEVNNQTQISVYSGRGALFQSKGPAWLWGTASEHSALYNYQIDGVESFFGGFMQTETPYYQPNPVAPLPMAINSNYHDPTLGICPSSGLGADGVPCKNSWGMRIMYSKGVLIYSTGMYSFFNNYGQECVLKHNCQEYMIRIMDSEVAMYAVTTLGAVNMISDDARESAPVLSADNRDTYGDTMAFYFTGSK